MIHSLTPLDFGVSEPSLKSLDFMQIGSALYAMAGEGRAPAPAPPSGTGGTASASASSAWPSSTPAPVPPPRSGRNIRRVTELRCSEVRWFYRRKDLDTKWIPLKGRDSISVEMRYRKSKNLEIDATTIPHVDEIGEEVVVLEGLYRVNDDYSRISAVYWKDDDAELRRGSWFLPDGQPIQSSMAEVIEAHHLANFRDHAIPDAASMFSDKEASRRPQLTEVSLPENIEVKWNSVVDVYLFSTTKASRFLRYMAFGRDTRLRRGYATESEWVDGAPDISHLILVVHGIGQKGYENLIAKNTEQIREAITAVMDKQMPDESSRPMLLPVEWRSQLILDDGATDVITLPKMASMRSTLNSTAMDIMYYQSPLYRKEIVGGVVKALNQAFGLFKRHNPTYKGPVSIFAHSLGSVISYDIITHWSPLVLYDEYVANAIKEQLEDSADDTEAVNSMSRLQDERARLQQTIAGGIHSVLHAREEQLRFPVSNLFCVGSPLGVFLVMRGAEPDTVVPNRDTCGRIFNIFHPYDPVAYRLEPLYAPELRNIRPVKIFSAGDSRAKSNYDEITPDVYKAFLKKKKAQEKKAKNGVQDDAKDKSGKSKEPIAAEDDLDEEDECDSDDSASNVRSACSSPRSMSPPREESKDKAKPAVQTTGSGWWFGSAKKEDKKEKKEKEEKEKEAEKAAENAPSIVRLCRKTNRPHKRRKRKSKKKTKKHRKLRGSKSGQAKKKGRKLHSGSRGAHAFSEPSSAGGSSASSRAAENKRRFRGKKKQMSDEEAEGRKLTEADRIMSTIPEDRRPSKRIDYNVQPALTDKSYWSVLKSHFSYWTNPDLAMFLVNVIYKERDEAKKEPPQSNPSEKVPKSANSARSDPKKKDKSDSDEKDDARSEEKTQSPEDKENKRGRAGKDHPFATSSSSGDDVPEDTISTAPETSPFPETEMMSTCESMMTAEPPARPPPPSSVAASSTASASTAPSPPPSTAPSPPSAASRHSLLETPLSALSLPTEEHLLPPDAKGRSPVLRPPPTD